MRSLLVIVSALMAGLRRWRSSNPSAVGTILVPPAWQRNREVVSGARRARSFCGGVERELPRLHLGERERRAQEVFVMFHGAEKSAFDVGSHPAPDSWRRRGPTGCRIQRRLDRAVDAMSTFTPRRGDVDGSVVVRVLADELRRGFRDDEVEVRERCLGVDGEGKRDDLVELGHPRPRAGRGLRVEGPPWDHVRPRGETAHVQYRGHSVEDLDGRSGDPALTNERPRFSAPRRRRRLADWRA
jgi:hypothetical protein